MARTHHVRIRLAPAPRPAIEVTLDDAELAAVDAAAAELGREGNRSDFLRYLGWHAAKDAAQSLDAEAAFRQAADAACMGVGEWVRAIALGAIGYSKLAEQIELARGGLAGE